MKKRYVIVLRDRSDEMVGYMHYNVRAERNLTEEAVREIIIDTLKNPLYYAGVPWSSVTILGSERVVLTREQVMGS